MIGVAMVTHEFDGASDTAEAGETERGTVVRERGKMMAVYCWRAAW